MTQEKGVQNVSSEEHSYSGLSAGRIGLAFGTVAALFWLMYWVQVYNFSVFLEYFMTPDGVFIEHCIFSTYYPHHLAIPFFLTRRNFACPENVGVTQLTDPVQLFVFYVARLFLFVPLGFLVWLIVGGLGYRFWRRRHPASVDGAKGWADYLKQGLKALKHRS